MVNGTMPRESAQRRVETRDYALVVEMHNGGEMHKGEWKPGTKPWLVEMHNGGNAQWRKCTMAGMHNGGRHNGGCWSFLQVRPQENAVVAEPGHRRGSPPEGRRRENG